MGSTRTCNSHCMVIGPHHYDYLAHVTLSGSNLMWTSSIKYLGIVMMTGSSFNIDFDQARRNFFLHPLTCILKNCTGASELIKYLCESYCLPVLSYAIESLNPSKTIVGKLNVYWNSVYRKIFS